MSKITDFLTGLKNFYTEDKHIDCFSFDRAWYDYVEKNRDQKTIEEAHGFIYYARHELDTPCITQPLLERVINPIKYNAYNMYNYRVAEDFGYAGLINLLDRAIELNNIIDAFLPVFKQKVAEIKKQEEKRFIIQNSALTKYNLNSYGPKFVMTNIGSDNGLILITKDEGWVFNNKSE